MTRNTTFSKRRLMLFSALVSAAIGLALLSMRRKPRPFLSLNEIAAPHLSRAWNVEVAPDIDGPYRSACDDWSGAGMVQFNPGMPAKGWVTSGGSKRTFDYPGRAGVSYLVAFLENAEDQPTYLILSKPGRDTPTASSGG